MGATKLLVSLALTITFAFVIVSYAFGFASDNNAVIDLQDDAELSRLNLGLENRTQQFRLDAQDKSEIFARAKISSGDETTTSGIQFKGLFTSLKTSISLILQTVNTKIFGGDGSFGVVTTMFLSILVVLIFLSIWKVWKGGNPD